MTHICNSHLEKYLPLHNQEIIVMGKKKIFKIHKNYENFPCKRITYSATLEPENCGVNTLTPALEDLETFVNGNYQEILDNALATISQE